MGSDIPDRFTVPASTPGLAKELTVPRYFQEIHAGQYRVRQRRRGLVQPHLLADDHRVLGAQAHGGATRLGRPGLRRPAGLPRSRFTYDYQYGGCGNWPFNAAYAATYKDLPGVVTRLRSLTDLETLIAAGIPAITSSRS